MGANLFYSVLIKTTESTYDETVTALWELETAGIVDEPRGVRAFFDSREIAEVAAQTFSQNVIQLSEEKLPAIPAKEDWEPFVVGEHFFIAPSTSTMPAPSGRIRLTVDAGSAFGSGRHESTQLTIQALETYLRPNMTVLDVGCGSGILSSAAHLLGAAEIFACDIDPNAISVAQLVDSIAVFAGSADAVKARVADLVLANISARIVDAIAPDLHRVCKPDGYVIIAGFIQDQLPRRWIPEKILTAGEWQCWFCRRDPILAESTPAPLSHSRQWW